MLNTMGLPLICNEVFPVKNIICWTKFINFKTVEVCWQADKVVDSKKYIIEYSCDAVNWLTAGTLVALPQKSRYTFPHEFYTVNSKMYYRIKAILKNGNFIYSNVAIASRKMLNNELAVYPNPASNSISFYTIDNDIAINLATIYTTQGVVLKQFWYKPNYAVDISSIENGTYYIKLKGNEKVLRLIVLK